MANDARFSADAGGFPHLLADTGKLDLPGLVEDPDIADLGLSPDIVGDLVDVVSRVEHHGIVGAQPDGIAQPVGLVDGVTAGCPLVIFNVHVGPNRDAAKQDQTNPEDQLEGQTLANVRDLLKHGRIHPGRFCVADSHLVKVLPGN
jgi:hypothetical protein